MVGAEVGTLVGAGVGPFVGAGVETLVGTGLGPLVGAGVGFPANNVKGTRMPIGNRKGCQFTTERDVISQKKRMLIHSTSLPCHFIIVTPVLTGAKISNLND